MDNYYELNEIEDKNENKKIEKNGTDENMSENNNISLQENTLRILICVYTPMEKYAYRLITEYL